MEPEPVRDELFHSERWNDYADPEPDPIDQPSPLLDQLRWLEEAGHAIFGGVKGR